MIDLAIVTATTAAAVSWLDPADHGSVANASLINASHWLLLFLLCAFRANAPSYWKTDIEITWMLYGFIIGQIDSDSTASTALVLISAASFQQYRRQQRLVNATAPSVHQSTATTDDGDSV